MLNRFIEDIKRRFAGRQRMISRQNAARALISESKLFDAKWYLERYPDVASTGIDPLDHFVQHGAAEGRNPSQRFDLRWYLKRHPDVARSGTNPLLHYLEHGRDEGRSIRAVSSSREAEAETTLTKKKATEPPVAPYPSDFTQIWHARSIDWGAFALHPASTDTSMEKGSATDWLSDLMHANSAETPEAARVELFHAMRRDSAAMFDRRDAMPPQNTHHLLIKHGLGLQAVADGWFAGNGRLFLRVHNAVGARAQLQAFQYAVGGELRCCADAQVADVGSQLVCLSLEQQLHPILLTWRASDGRLLRNALISFPSLFRGGLHHAEVAASEVISGERATISGLMTRLTLGTYCAPDGSDAFTIGRIAVDLKGANGSERIFNATAIAALATQFGILLEPHGSSPEKGLQKLMQQLEPTLSGRHASLRSTGRTLILPSDGFPSLASLAARGPAPQLGTGSYCIVDAFTGHPDALVCLPGNAAGADGLHHPALPLPAPRLLAATSDADTVDVQFGAPIMIRFRDAKIWQIDAFMPLSPDTALPLLSQSERAPRPCVTVILDQPETDEQLALCLSSLARQSVADDLEIILIAGKDDAEVDLPSAVPITRCHVSDASPAERLNQAASNATSDYLLFLHPSVCLSDPRTVGLLLDLIAKARIASASCALIREEDAHAVVEAAGYVQHDSDAERLVRGTEIARLLPASTFPVAGNDMRLSLIPASLWRELGGLDAHNFSHAGFDMDFGLRALAAGFEHYCTTLIRASISGPAKTDELRPVPFVQQCRVRLPERVTRHRKLHS
jgi:hypothetical protein